MLDENSEGQLEDQDLTEETEGDEESQMYDIGGNEYSVDDIQSWKADSDNKSAWQKAYTERDMSIAETKRELEKTKQLEEYLVEHPEKYQEIEKIFKSENQVEGQQNPEVYQTLSEVQRIRDEMIEEREGIRLDQEMSALKDQYSSYFEGDSELGKKIVQYAYDNRLPSVKMAFRDMMFDKHATDKLKDGEQRGQNAIKRSKNLSSPSGSKSNAKSPHKVGQTEQQWRQSVMNDSKYDGIAG